MSNTINILVTGANGQVGMELRALSGKYPACNFFFAGRNELPITNLAAIENYFSKHALTHCINCAAYTAVDKAESEKELAYETNAVAAAHLAAVCRKNKVTFIHFSTDYVFDGNGSVPYNESDQTGPQAVYGYSKLEGENAVLKNNDEAIIIRTSWVYSSFGKNFVKTMLKLMSEKESIGVVNDQLGCPTYAADLAEAVLKIISENNRPAAGIYNYCNEGITSWYEFAMAIKNISGSKCMVNPITTNDYPTPAKRPHYSVLDTTKIKETFHLSIPGWKQSLEKCLKLLNASR